MAGHTPAEMRALVRLLGDQDEQTAAIARTRLMESGEAALSFLAEGVRDADARIRARSRLLIEAIRFNILKERFRRYASLPDEELDLETGAFLIASYGYPEVEMAPYRHHLDVLAERVREDFQQAEDADTAPYPHPLPRQVAVLVRRLFELERFRGNEEGYYEVDNSFLHRVLERRLGIPISLSAVVLLIAHRLGWPLYGVGLPGHFIVGYHPGLSGSGAVGIPSVPDASAAVWIDPFNGGRVLAKGDCYRLIRHAGHEPDPALLQPVPVRMAVVRMLRNLANIYRHTNRPQQLQEVGELMDILLDPGAADGRP